MKFESAPLPEKSEADGFSRRNFLKMAGKAVLGAATLGAVSKLGKTAEAFEKLEKETPEQQYQDWQNLKHIIKSAHVRDVFGYARKKFGRVAEPLLLKPALDLQLVDTMLSKEAEGIDLRKDESGRRFLKEASKNYQRFWNSDAIDERRKERELKEGLKAEIRGFEAISGLSNTDLQKKLEANFNLQWLYGNISSFEFINTPKRWAHYGVAGEAEGRGIQSILTKNTRQQVRLHPYAEMTPERIVETIAHEIGHHQDWENNNRLPIHERLVFLHEVSERFNSGDRWHDGYIDIDIPKEYGDKKSDHKELQYRQIKEYWATIIELYTIEPLRFKQTHPKDFALAEKWYQRLTRQ